MHARSFALLVTAILALGAPLATADKDRDGRDGHDGDRGRLGFDAHGGDRFIFHNDKIAVWFHAGHNKAKPDVRVVFNGTDDEKAGYRVQILRICEVTDDLRCQGNLPHVNLARAEDWNVVKDQTNDSLTLTMTRAEAQAIVTLVWHLNTTSATVKFDLRVQNWRWANASDKLMLDSLVLGHDLKNSTGANVSVENSGYIRWSSTATSNLGNLTVDPVTKRVRDVDDDDHDKDQDDDSPHEKDERHSGKGGHLMLVFNGTGGYSDLHYDPELGVMSAGSSPVPAVGPVAVIAVVALAAMAIGARRRN